MDDYVPDNVPDNFYAPIKPVEQTVQENQERELNAAQISIVQEVVADFEALFEEIRDIKYIDTESNVPLSAQLIGRQFARGWAEAKMKKWQDRMKSKMDSLSSGGESL